MSVRPQAITGVSAGQDQLLRTVYPSISSAGLGRLIGQLMDSIPVGVGNIKLSYLIFGPLLVGPALMGYFAEKLMGQRYLLTNRAIRRWTLIGQRMLQEVQLADIEDIAVEVQAGQEFYKAGDLVIIGKGGNTLMRLPGVPRPDIFRETILKAQKARLQVEDSLTRIRARQTAGAK